MLHYQNLKVIETCDVVVSHGDVLRSRTEWEADGWEEDRSVFDWSGEGRTFRLRRPGVSLEGSESEEREECALIAEQYIGITRECTCCYGMGWQQKYESPFSPVFTKAPCPMCGETGRMFLDGVASTKTGIAAAIRTTAATSSGSVLP